MRKQSQTILSVAMLTTVLFLQNSVQVGARQPVEKDEPTFRSNAAKVISIPDCEPGQIIVQLRQDVDSNELNQMLGRQLNARIIDSTSDGALTFALLEVSREPQKFCRIFTQLAHDKKHFSIVQPNLHYYPARRRPLPPTPSPPPSGGWPLSGAPNDPDYAQQSQAFVHSVVEAQEWLATKGYAMPLVTGGLIIGIIDTGVQGNISDFVSGQVLAGTNVWTNAKGNTDSDSSSLTGHGTFCATLMAATANNGVNGVGVLPGATICPVDAFAGRKFTDTFHIVKGIQYLQNQPGVRFINISINGSPPNTFNADTTYLAAAQAFSSAKNGCIFNAAGNDSDADNSVPVPYNVCVQAVDSNLNRASFSNYGPAISLAGAGVNDGSTDKRSRFAVSSGTSFAAPSCCAIAAMLSYAAPGLPFGQILKIMQQNANLSTDKIPVPDALRCVKAITGP